MYSQMYNAMEENKLSFIRFAYIFKFHDYLPFIGTEHKPSFVRFTNTRSNFQKSTVVNLQNLHQKFRKLPNTLFQ